MDYKIAKRFENLLQSGVMMDLSWIQKHALLILIRQREARVKELMPPDIAPNLFAYHLDGLVAAKLIEKHGRGVYRLTAKGEKFIGTFSTALDKQVEAIKTVVMLYARSNDGYLLFRWSRQPYLGYVTPLYDHMPRGKSLDEAIQSALHDKLDGDYPVRFMTSVLVKVMHEDELVSHMNMLVYRVDLNGVLLPISSRNGEAFVAPVDETDGIMTGIAEFFEQLESATGPFESIWRY